MRRLVLISAKYALPALDRYLEEHPDAPRDQEQLTEMARLSICFVITARALEKYGLEMSGGKPNLN